MIGCQASRRIFKGIPDALRGEVWYRLLELRKLQEVQAGVYQVQSSVYEVQSAVFTRFVSVVYSVQSCVQCEINFDVL